MENQNNNTETTEKNGENNMNSEIYSGCGCKNPNTFVDTMKSGFEKAFKNMKTVCVALVAAITLGITGCATLPTVDGIYKTSSAIGVASGMVANNIKIDTTVRNQIVEIMGVVELCIPETNQSFNAAWTPIAEKHTQKLVDEGKIDERQGKLILETFDVATKGLDYLFEVRFPEARKYQDLTEAAVHGFCGGFLSMFKPVNVAQLSTGKVEYDEEAYQELSK